MELQIEWHQGDGVHRGIMIPWRSGEESVKRVALPSRKRDEIARMIERKGQRPDEYIFAINSNNFIYAKEISWMRDQKIKEPIKIDDGAIEIFWIDDDKRTFSAYLIPLDVASELSTKTMMTWAYGDEKDVRFTIACRDLDPDDYLQRSRFGYTSMGWIRGKQEIFDPSVRSFLWHREKRVPPTVRVNE